MPSQRIVGVIHVLVLGVCAWAQSQSQPSCAAQQDYQDNVDASNLVNYLLSIEDRNLRPRSCNGTTHVSLLWELSNFYLESNDSTPLYSISGDLDVSWTDTRLSWDPSKYNNRLSVRIPSSQIWKPDITVYSASKMAINLFGGNYFFGDWSATISSDGKVIYSPQTSASFLCNTTSDPAGDLVSCVQRLGPWAYDIKSVDAQPESAQINVDPYDPFNTAQYTVVSATASRTQLVYPCCPGTSYTVVDIHLTMRRKLSAKVTYHK